ncbi:cytochrome c1 [Parashewanella spongiae]|uniref:Cytochrome c1 n=1 Tax=Parashewanella spongiae TaxID=342950 RepID=A0A3A6U4A2_9GAMM|nr:cytochrome c1 [Parashewanella spongiae]MCL1077405.1 cytochrome c1 [Parashewanella spongiae]RJY18970.1 cytochrome c1 [Parashewanella spongiae]
MKKLIIALVTLLPTMAMAAGGNVHLEQANIDLTDKASLERGLDSFQKYCSGCHSTKYQRYERVATDLGISLDDMRTKYIHNGAKVGELMTNSIPQKEAAKWFGATPPDLTLAARVRGEDWLYTYLKGFYKDTSRPFGVNNSIFPSVGMPHVMQELQGIQEQVCSEDEQGHKTCKLTEAKGGTLSAEEYDQTVRDITGFLVYSGDPVRLERESLGWYVLGFLFIFFIISYFLKKEYWRDVH